MRIAVVSDTHGHQANTRAAVHVLASLEVETVLHCGDIGSVEVVELFAPWPTHFVFGNGDRSIEDELRRAIEAAGLVCHGQFAALELGGRKIAMLHSHDPLRFRETIASGKWDLVCYGHTHAAERYFAGATLVLNPGALFRASPHTLAIVELPALEVTSIVL